MQDLNSIASLTPAQPTVSGSTTTLQPQPDEPGYKAVSLQPILDEIKQFEQEHNIGKK